MGVRTAPLGASKPPSIKSLKKKIVVFRQGGGGWGGGKKAGGRGGGFRFTLGGELGGGRVGVRSLVLWGVWVVLFLEPCSPSRKEVLLKQKSFYCGGGKGANWLENFQAC